MFAIEQFHHFAYMAVGVAMLGVGASGTLVAALGAAGSEHRRARSFQWAAILATAGLVASPALVHLVRLDATRLAWEASSWLRLTLVYALLALPFFLGGLTTLYALTLEPERPGRLYGASFVGAGLGTGLAVGILWIASPARALALPAIVAGLGAIATGHGKRDTGHAHVAPHVSRIPFPVSRLSAWLALACTLVVFAQPPWRLTITPYKGLPQVEAYPEARRVAERTSPVGWVVAVDAAAFRYAPGLSLGYRGAFPRQTALFVDGELAGAVTSWNATPGAGELLDWLPTALPFATGVVRRVLVIGAGGGLEVSNALAHGAERVTAVELSSDIVRLARAAPVAPNPAAEARVQWVAADARSYVARVRERFDLITIGPGAAFGTSAGGLHALDQDFLHTVDAYTADLERLGDEGVLAVTRWLTVPPREPVRVILTATEALRRLGPTERGLVVARSWGSATVLVKPSGFTGAQVAALRDWSTARGFDLDWYPGAESPEAMFHLLDEPTLFRATQAAVASPAAAAAFAAAYPFDVAPVEDTRPYPHHFLRPASLKTFLATTRGSWLPFAEWGSIALLATLAQSVVLGALLLLGAWFGRVTGRRPSRHPSAALLGYFAFLGLAYLGAEIAAIQQLELLLGHPVYAVAAVLAAFLAASGAGSSWSDRRATGGARSLGLVLAGALIALAAGLLGLVHGAQGAALGVRAALALIVLGPVAFLMGMPFPLGIRLLAARDPTLVAWAWAANGFASVVAAPLAALVALEAGSPALFLGAAVCYAGAGAIARFHRAIG